MKHCLSITLLAASAIALSTSCQKEKMHENPFLSEYATEYGIPPFDQIVYDDYLPALKAGIEQQNEEIAVITDNEATPTFDNTIMALERSGAILDRVVPVFYALEESNSSDEMVEIGEQFHQLYQAHADEMMMNDKLFNRVKYLYENRDSLGLAPDQYLLVENTYKDFTRNGALLSDSYKEKLKALNSELTDLYNQFNKNLLNATNAFSVVIDKEEDLAGLPAGTVAVAAEEASSRGMEGKWVFTLHAPSRLPVLQFAANRDLRRRIYEGYTSLASDGEYNNLPVINKILQARAKKAALLGFKDFGSYMTDNVMAGTTEAAENLLMKIWTPAVAKVKEEVAEMQAIVDAEGGDFKIQPYDYYYYAEKVRQKKYDFDESQVSAYFPVDSVRKGIFGMAEKLYGVKFTEMKDAPKYYDEVNVYDVTDAATGEHVAVFMTDYFTRPSKRQGAWMSEFKG
ncbi:MAG: peptidase M3, partial [Muribaculaceae bacterium]|nr:peptidase M3 [Muribaculaceae bacterium]